MDNSAQEEDLAKAAINWVQANMIKLGQQFGVDFKGSKKEAYTMLTKMDQRRAEQKGKEDMMQVSSSKNIEPKEM